MTNVKNRSLQVFLLASLLTLSGCSILDGIYDDAAQSACDSEIDGKSRVDCYDRAEDARRERDGN